MAPEKRERINDLEYPNFGRQESRRLNDKNDEAEDWRLQTGAGIGEHGQSTYFLEPQLPANPAKQYIDSIAPVDDVVSVHDNRFLDGRVCFNPEVLNEVDWKLSSWSYQWDDPPCLPYTRTTTLQPLTSNDAIRW